MNAESGGAADPDPNDGSRGQDIYLSARPRNRVLCPPKLKRRAQEEIRADYKAHKHEFASYGEFMEARIRENPWASAMLEKLTGGEKAKTSGR